MQYVKHRVDLKRHVFVTELGVYFTLGYNEREEFTMQMVNVRCCCDGQKVVGLLPAQSQALAKNIFEFDDGESEFAFSSEDMTVDQLEGINGFRRIEANKGKSGSWAGTGGKKSIGGGGKGGPKPGGGKGSGKTSTPRGGTWRK